MTDKHARFVEEFLIDSNATQAAIRAGYSPASARVTGHRLLTDAAISAEIARRRLVVMEESGITRERVLAELTLLSFSSVEHYKIDDYGYLQLAEGAPPGAMRAVSTVKRRIKSDEDGNTIIDAEFRLWDKPGPLRLAGKHVGLFSEKPDIDLSSLPREVLELLRRQLKLN